jgi:hypothetical protein
MAALRRRRPQLRGQAERMYANGTERISPTAGRPVGGWLTAPPSAADHYEAEYSWQELKLDALRQRIGVELGNRAPGATDGPAPRPGGEEDPRNPPKGSSTR